MKTILLLLFFAVSAQAETKVTGGEISPTSSITISSLVVVSTTGLTLGGANTTISGYVNLPNGLLLQWGQISATMVHGNTYTATFPKPFPHSMLQVTGYMTNTAPSQTTITYCPLNGGDGINNFTCQYGAINGGAYASLFRYIAIGY